MIQVLAQLDLLKNGNEAYFLPKSPVKKVAPLHSPRWAARRRRAGIAGGPVTGVRKTQNKNKKMHELRDEAEGTSCGIVPFAKLYHPEIIQLAVNGELGLGRLSLL